MTDFPSEPPAIRQSNALHARVQKFAQCCDTPNAATDIDGKFEQLALDIAHFQQAHSSSFARMTAMNGGSLKRLSDIPVIPSDVFRLTRAALHPKELDVACFETSGTTSESTGSHPVRNMATKETLTLLQARRTLFSDHGRGIVVALQPKPDEPARSSLSHMMELFMREFDGKPLSPDPRGAAFSSRTPGRWLVDSHGPNIEGLRRAARIARHRSEPLYILSTSFALVAMLDALDGEVISSPNRTTVMITGGFKGRTRTVDERELRTAAARALSTTEEQIWGEYGMTELSSQMFEHRATKDSAALSDDTAWWSPRGPAGTYFPPPWLKVTSVDPTSYRPLPHGEPGLAHFIDLANVDSCLSVVTQDVIVTTETGGIRLKGRQPRAPTRGCSLPFEGLILVPPQQKRPG